MLGDDNFLGNLRKNLQYAIQWLPKGAIKPMQVQPSATVGDVLTTTANGSEWGSDIWIPKSIGDAKGDLIGFSAADTPVKIAKASGDGYTLTSDTSQTGGVKWQPPICGMYYLTTGGLSISIASWTALTTLFNQIEYERTLAGSSHYNTTTGRFTAPVSGVYRFTVNLAITAASSTETYGIGLFLNGSIHRNNHIQAVSNGYFYDCRSWDQYLAAGSYVQAGWFQNSATTRNWSNSRRDCSFAWELLTEASTGLS